MNVYNRLLDDSVQKKQRRIHTSKYQRGAIENTEWQTKLLAANRLSIPSIINKPPPFHSSSTLSVSKSLFGHENQMSTKYSPSKAKPESKAKHSDFNMLLTLTPSGYSSFPNRQEIQSRLQNKYPNDTFHVPPEKVKLPKPNGTTKKLDMYSNEAIMNEPIKGIDSFPLPPVDIPKGFILVPCRSNIVAFYDKQGTY